MSAYLVGLVGALLVLGGIIELLRRRQLKEKYAVLWLLVGLGVAVLTLLPGLLGTVSDALGVEIPSNLLFFAAIVLLLGVSAHLSWEISRLEDKTRRLAEDVALLRLEQDRSASGNGAGVGREIRLDVPQPGTEDRTTAPSLEDVGGGETR